MLPKVPPSAFLTDVDFVSAVAHGVPRVKYPGIFCPTTSLLVNLTAFPPEASETLAPTSTADNVVYTLDIFQPLGCLPLELVFPLLSQGTQSTQVSSKSPLICCALAPRQRALKIISVINFFIRFIFLKLSFALSVRQSSKNTCTQLRILFRIQN